MGLLSKVMPGKKKSKNGGGGNSNEGTPPPSPPTDEKSTPKLPLTEDGAKPQADDEQKPTVQASADPTSTTTEKMTEPATEDTKTCDSASTAEKKETKDPSDDKEEQTNHPAYTGSWSSRSTTTGRKISAEITLSTKTEASAHTPNNLTTAAEKPTGEPAVCTPAGGSEPVAAEPEKKSESAVKKDDKVVDEILGKLHLDNPEYSTEEKLEALCLVFRETIAENVKYKNASANINEQLEKNDQTKSALQNLCKALKTQIELKQEEGELRLREEAQKRLDVTQNFETVIRDLTTLVNENASVNKKLKEENLMLAGKMQELVASHDQSIARYSGLKEEYGLQMKLYDAKLAKASLEKTEVSANANEQRLELQKMLVESDEKVTMMMGRETNLKEQLELYQSQVNEMESNLGGTTTTFNSFRKEMDRLTKQLKKVERDTDEWKNKFQESQDHIQRMNRTNQTREQEFQQLQRKLQAMEKLNRTLTAERKKASGAPANKAAKPNGDCCDDKDC